MAGAPRRGRRDPICAPCGILGRVPRHIAQLAGTHRLLVTARDAAGNPSGRLVAGFAVSA
jgi:hypothetical protein